MSKTVVGLAGGLRCSWCSAAPEFLANHDTEWGFHSNNNHRLFEKLSLEAFQSGLSWRTILPKCENFRAVFRDYDFDKIARFTRRDLDRLLKDGGLVRHRGEIESVINNARHAQKFVSQEGRWQPLSGATNQDSHDSRTSRPPRSRRRHYLYQKC